VDVDLKALGDDLIALTITPVNPRERWAPLISSIQYIASELNYSSPPPPTHLVGDTPEGNELPAFFM